MKRSWHITILVCLLLLAGGGAVVLLPRIVPYEQCSDLYKQYADTEGITASFIKEYPINDTVAVDVTLLAATTDSAWSLLQERFQVPPLNDVTRQLIDSGKDIVFTLQASKTDGTVELGNDYERLLGISYLTKQISVFHVKSEEEIRAVLFHNLDKSVQQN